MSSTQSMRAAMFYGSGDLRIQQVASPVRAPGQVVVRPDFCGICGSDLHFYFEKAMADTLNDPHPLTGESVPIPFGHEFAGVVVEVGSEPLVDGSSAGQPLAVGDRVAIMPVISDGDCFACRSGSPNVCSQVGFIGLNGQSGGMSDRAVLPSKHVVKLPSSIPTDIGALVEPLAVSWHALELIDNQTLTSSSSILILGGGPVGCCVLLCLMARGVSPANITISEPNDGRRGFLKTLAEVTMCHPDNLDALVPLKMSEGKRGFDVAFDCAGVPTSLSTAVQHVRAKGTVIGLALQFTAVIPTTTMMLKEIRLEFSLAYTLAEFEAVIAAIDQGLIKPEAMITKRIALDDVVKEGLEVLHSKGNSECKILIDMTR